MAYYNQAKGRFYVSGVCNNLFPTKLQHFQSASRVNYVMVRSFFIGSVSFLRNVLGRVALFAPWRRLPPRARGGVSKSDQAANLHNPSQFHCRSLLQKVRWYGKSFVGGGRLMSIFAWSMLTFCSLRDWCRGYSVPRRINCNYNHLIRIAYVGKPETETFHHTQLPKPFRQRCVCLSNIKARLTVCK